uniref:WD repeat domain 52 n=1 Tax=Neogobius melanostomus TaxID=47308 RepID=A0A8C6TSR1_9GOBI
VRDEMLSVCCVINSADSHGEGSCFELEPMNELVIGHNISLSSMVRSGQTDSFVWYAQDTMGAIWKLDLSFTHTTPDPECLFQFHSGAIQGMDVSRSSHLLATTALGRSVKVYDFLSNKQLASGRFNQGGTALCWAPALVSSGGLLVVGFEDGVVRLLDVFDPQRLQTIPERSRRGRAELRLRQAFKPHSASVSAVAYDRNARILATASADCSVFFFSAGEKYRPIGFVSVPGPVRALEWSPHFHSASCLLVLCQTGHVLEVQSPDPEQPQQTQTFELSTLQTRAFFFKSIKSRIKVSAITRRQVLREKKRREREEQLKQTKDLALEPEEQPEEEEEELPSIYLPSPPSPLCCGFYSQPGHFWLAMVKPTPEEQMGGADLCWRLLL